MDTLSIFLRKLTLQTELGPRARDAVLALPHIVRELAPASYILREGERPTRCALLLSGFAYRHKLTVDGARQIVSLHVGGDPLDLQSLFLDVADHNIQTLNRTQVAFVQREDIQKLFRDHADVARALFINALIDASIFREWVVNVGRRDARSRVAHLLCELNMRLASIGSVPNDIIDLPMTQEQLGDALGLTPVHVNRTLRVMEAEGLIRRKRRQVVSVEWERLCEISGFNARYLHLDRQMSGLPV